MITPDNWVVLQINNKELLYKVLAGWSGSYTTGSSWRLNSGITKVKKEGDYYLFYGYSGSVYKCHKDSYRLTMANGPIYDQLMKLYPTKVKLLDDREDWESLI